MAVSGSAPTVRGCRFESNFTTEYAGGAMLVNEDAAPTIDSCHFEGNIAIDAGGGVACYGSAPTITDCTFVGNASLYFGGGAVFSGWGGAPHVIACSLVGNSGSPGAGVMCYQDATATIDNSIIAFSTAGNAVACYVASDALLACCDIFGNPGGDWTGAIASQLGVAGNLCADPLFCGNENPPAPLTLHATSPCAPAQHPACGLIGAWPVACGGTSGTGDATGPATSPAGPAPPALALGPCRPNPTGGWTQIRFAVPPSLARAPVRLEIFDAGGRLVRTLVDAPAASPDPCAVTWDGLGERGARAPAGIYFCRLTAGGEHRSRKLIVAH